MGPKSGTLSPRDKVVKLSPSPCGRGVNGVKAKRSMLAGTPLKQLGVLALALALPPREREPNRLNLGFGQK
jgi:hypothetical protein